MSDTAPPPAGWYADPEDPARERWWNGSGWSDQHRPSTVGPAETPTIPTPSGFAYGTGATDARPDPYATPDVQPNAAASSAGPASSTNGLAVAGLIVSLAGWFIVPLLGPAAGIVLSIFGLREARRREAMGNPNSGRGLALAGLIIGIVVAGISVLGIILYIGLIVSVTSNPYYY